MKPYEKVLAEDYSLSEVYTLLEGYGKILTAKEMIYYQFLRYRVNIQNMPPTIREIKETLGFGARVIKKCEVACCMMGLVKIRVHQMEFGKELTGAPMKQFEYQTFPPLTKSELHQKLITNQLPLEPVHIGGILPDSVTKDYPFIRKRIEEIQASCLESIGKE